MLNEHLKTITRPYADYANIVRWGSYRVTVLGDRLFRLEQSDKEKFRDEATQAVWFRDMPRQTFSVAAGREQVIIDTGACRLILKQDKGQVCVELDGKTRYLNNNGNLLGTYRTLDRCDGGTMYKLLSEKLDPSPVPLCNGVCSKTGVAVLDDSSSLTLGRDGEVRNEGADGTDEYIFAFGTDYRGAVCALYALTGSTPLLPRFALGNWWSRYHAYTDEEYLRVLAAFEERGVPLSVATVDMDWHYSNDWEEELQIAATGKNTPEYIGKPAVWPWWTGYTWNKNLFPDYPAFLRALQEKGVKVTLNLHPSDGVRFWETQYTQMANAMGVDPDTQVQIPFDFTRSEFINAYFDILHHPYEEEGVNFWWMDWQQPNIPWGEGEYDPLWALNHYHYLDNARRGNTPLVLSRYAGIGSHRYPVGFSGDTEISWKTLEYLPYFTATASNVGYTWWSHDIGGHNFGEKRDELYLRHIQYGVFSPINRLHCACDETMSKEPWTYGVNGLVAERFLRLRHELVPYLYTAAWRTHTEGRALVEPLYYEWKHPLAYRYGTEYLFGSELLVLPVTAKAYPDGFSRVRAWIPQGVWTDIFTGDEYEVGEEGKSLTLLRTLESLPVLIKRGGILPLSKDGGNGCKNPVNLEVWSYVGDGEYTLYEDGREEKEDGICKTYFSSSYVETEGVCTQSLTIFAEGEEGIIPKNRLLSVRFKNIPSGEVRLLVDGEEVPTKKWLTDCPALRFAMEKGKRYRVEVVFAGQSRLEKWKCRAERVLLLAEGENLIKYALYTALKRAASEEEFLAEIEKSPLPLVVKQRLKEII